MTLRVVLCGVGRPLGGGACPLFGVSLCVVSALIAVSGSPLASWGGLVVAGLGCLDSVLVDLGCWAWDLADVLGCLLG